jgi:hypothetical protein
MESQPPLTRANCAANFGVEVVMCKFSRRSAVGWSSLVRLLDAVDDTVPENLLVHGEITH